MTALLAPPTLGWEIHRDRADGWPTAIAYYGEHEAVRFSGPRTLLRLRIALWSRALARYSGGAGIPSGSPR